MVDSNPEHATPSPSVLAEISVALKEKGVFERDLTPQEVEQFMREIIVNMMEDSGKSQATINALSVSIDQAIATLQANVSVTKPVKVVMDLGLTLENSGREGELKLLREPDVSGKGTFAGPAKKRAKSFLNNPNELIYNGLNKYFSKEGVQLSALALRVNQNSLGVRLQSTGI